MTFQLFIEKALDWSGGGGGGGGGGEAMGKESECP